MEHFLDTVNQPSDADLIEQARSGQTAAFAEIVERHKDSLVGYLYRLVGDRERAEDVAQDAFLRLYQHSDSYEERGHLKAYLFRIATNQIRSEARRSSRWARVRSLLTSSNGRPPVQERTLLATELKRELLKAIAQLPLRYRTALVLRELEGWRYRTIAEALGCSEGTVKSRIHRGRKLLKRKLTHYWQGGAE